MQNPHSNVMYNGETYRKWETRWKELQDIGRLTNVDSAGGASKDRQNESTNKMEVRRNAARSVGE